MWGSTYFYLGLLVCPVCVFHQFSFLVFLWLRGVFQSLKPHVPFLRGKAFIPLCWYFNSTCPNLHAPPVSQSVACSKIHPTLLRKCEVKFIQGKNTKRIYAATQLQICSIKLFLEGGSSILKFFLWVGELGVWMCGLLNGSERCCEGGIANVVPPQITRLLTKDYRKFARSHQRGFVDAQTAAQKEFASAMMAAFSELLWPSLSKWSPHKGLQGPV